MEELSYKYGVKDRPPPPPPKDPILARLGIWLNGDVGTLGAIAVIAAIILGVIWAGCVTLGATERYVPADIYEQARKNVAGLKAIEEIKRRNREKRINQAK
jgi:hypothetical protein